MAGVVVVGGGIAGLVCAWRLHRAGHEVEVLEQSPGIGGRVRDESHGAIRVPVGASFVTEGQRNVTSVAMALGLESGMQSSLGRVPAPWDNIVNALLILQFPLLHSFLMHRRGRKYVAAVVPGSRGRTLAASTFATISALQLILVFLAWTPTGIVWFNSTVKTRRRTSGYSM